MGFNITKARKTISWKMVLYIWTTKAKIYRSFHGQLFFLRSYLIQWERVTSSCNAVYKKQVSWWIYSQPNGRNKSQTGPEWLVRTANSLLLESEVILWDHEKDWQIHIEENTSVSPRTN